VPSPTQNTAHNHQSNKMAAFSVRSSITREKYYQILGLNETATEQEIIKAYRKLAVQVIFVVVLAWHAFSCAVCVCVCVCVVGLSVMLSSFWFFLMLILMISPVPA